MKSFIFFFLLILTFSTVFSQQQFKAKEGIAASTKAASDGGLQSPELMLIATTSEQLEGIPISISFDISRGTASAWLYLYRSAKQTDSVKLIAVTKILNTYIPLTIPFSGGSNLFPYRSDTTLKDATWFDSDIMAQKIRENSTFQDFAAKNKDFKLTLTYISINPLPEPVALKDKAIWGIILNSNSARLSCLVHGETGEVFCQQVPTDVAMEESNQIKILNNPASENLYISFPIELQSDLNQFSIFNSSGALVKQFKNLNPAVSNLIFVPIADMGSGIYFLIFNSGNLIINLPFVVLR